MNIYSFNNNARTQLTRGAEHASEGSWPNPITYELIGHDDKGKINDHKKLDDQVLLAAREDHSETGKVFNRHTFILEATDRHGEADLKLEMKDGGFFSQDKLAVSSSENGAKIELEVPVGCLSSDLMQWFSSPGQYLADKMQEDGIQSVRVDRDGDDVKVEMFKAGGEEFSFAFESGLFGSGITMLSSTAGDAPVFKPQLRTGS